jgi:NADH-quinone oxidoreductase subunit J
MASALARVGEAGGRAGATLLAATTSAEHLAHAADWVVFLVGAGLILTGAFGVILLRNPVHCALLLVVTLFGVAVEFIDETAYFLAAVQIIVYAGAIVILFLFVIMFLGVDRRERIAAEPVRAQRPLALALGLTTLILLLVLSRVGDWTTGARSVTGAANAPSSTGAAASNVSLLGQLIYTRYLLPFEMTSALLVIAVVAAVVLARTRSRTAGEMTRSEHEEIQR